MDVGRQHRPRPSGRKTAGRFHANDEVLAGDHVGAALADVGPLPMPQTLIRQVVRFSGMFSDTSAMPSLSVISEPTHKAVSAKLLADRRLDQGGRSAAAEIATGCRPLPSAGLNIGPMLPASAIAAASMGTAASDCHAVGLAFGQGHPTGARHHTAAPHATPHSAHHTEDPARVGRPS